MAGYAYKIISQMLREPEQVYALDKPSRDTLIFQAIRAVEERHMEPERLLHHAPADARHNMRYNVRHINSRLTPDMKAALALVMGEYAEYRLGYVGNGDKRIRVLSGVDALEKSCIGLPRAQGGPDPFMSLLREALGEVDDRIAAALRDEHEMFRSMAL